MARKVRALAQHDWDQLLIVASGFIALERGDLKAAMARAITAHAALVDAVREGGIRAPMPGGEVHLYADEEGLMVAYETKTGESVPDLGLEVPDPPAQPAPRRR